MPDVMYRVIINSRTSCNSWHTVSYHTATTFKWQHSWAVALFQWIKIADHRMATEDYKTVCHLLQLRQKLLAKQSVPQRRSTHFG